MTDRPGSGVALVIQTRIADEGKEAYAAWQVKVGERLASRPGFLGQEIRTPAPPRHVDWFVIQHFRDHDAARQWMESPELSALLEEVERHFVGDSNISIVDDSRSGTASATVTISCRVPPENEAAYLEWEREIFRAEARFPGFVGHKLERPIPGISSRYTSVLTFASEKDLDGWLESSERARLIEEGQAFQEDVQIRKAGYGFDFWFRDGEAPRPSPARILKSNLLVLLVLYPLVFLWGQCVSKPLIEDHVPFWLSLFVGNLVSTQVLGWWAVPRTMKLFGWWLDAEGSRRLQVAGYLLLLMMYIASMALYAWLLYLCP